MGYGCRIRGKFMERMSGGCWFPLSMFPFFSFSSLEILWSCFISESFMYEDDIYDTYWV